MQITAGELVVGDFSWSPDGEEIVFSHKPTADLNVANQHGDISIVTVPSSSSIIEASANDGTDIEEPKELLHLGQVRSLVAGNGVESSPFWSPDGNWIAYTSSGSEPNLISLNDVYVIPSSGGDKRMLAETPNRSAKAS